MKISMLAFFTFLGAFLCSQQPKQLSIGPDHLSHLLQTLDGINFDEVEITRGYHYFITWAVDWEDSQPQKIRIEKHIFTFF